MIGGVADENVIGLPVREKRSFSTDRKLQLVEQASAPGASVSAVAKQNGLAPSQIFMWRKELRTGKLTETKNTEPLSAVEHYYQMLAKIERLQVEVGAVVAERVISDIKNGRLTTYNAACAYSNLVSSASKIETLRLEIIDRILALPPESVAQENQKSEMSPEQRKDLQRFSERLLVEMYRHK